MSGWIRLTIAINIWDLIRRAGWIGLVIAISNWDIITRVGWMRMTITRNIWDLTRTLNCMTPMTIAWLYNFLHPDSRSL